MRHSASHTVRVRISDIWIFHMIYLYIKWETSHIRIIQNKLSHKELRIESLEEIMELHNYSSTWWVICFARRVVTESYTCAGISDWGRVTKESVETQFWKNPACLLLYPQLPNRFEFLHMARQCDCRPFCNITKHPNSWNRLNCPVQTVTL